MKKLCLSFVVVLSLIFTVSCVSKELPVTETYYETEYRGETRYEIQDVVIGQKCGDDSINSILEWYAPNLTMASRDIVGSIACDQVWYFGCEIPHHDITHIKVTFSKSLSPNFWGHYSANAYDLGEGGQIASPPAGQWVIESEKPGYYQWGDLPWSHSLQDWIGMFNSRLVSARNLGKWEATAFSMDKGPTKAPNTLEFDANGVTNLAIIACGADFEWQPVQVVQLIWCDNVTEKRSVAKEEQVPYQIEKQRTIMQTKKVPFWEAIFH